mmetsp:Transcript_36983/g.99663  ORF Transcript_36983/g.99663 Transcript_36983/m.99663 type:complete len:223 (-) Transcript_36983:287-955(-)
MHPRQQVSTSSTTSEEPKGVSIVCVTSRDTFQSPQKRIAPSSEPDSAYWPSRDVATQSTGLVWPVKVARSGSSEPSSASVIPGPAIGIHSLTEQSTEPDKIAVWPSGDCATATQFTVPAWPRRVLRQHESMIGVPSRLGRSFAMFSWIFSFTLSASSSSAFGVKSHSFTVPSLLPDTARRPSAVMAQPLTTSVWPTKVCRRAPVGRSHSLTVCERGDSSVRM